MYILVQLIILFQSQLFYENDVTDLNWCFVFVPIHCRQLNMHTNASPLYRDTLIWVQRSLYDNDVGLLLS